MRKLRHFPEGGFQSIPVERRSRNGNVRRLCKQARRINLKRVALGGCLQRKLDRLRPDFPNEGPRTEAIASRKKRQAVRSQSPWDDRAAQARGASAAPEGRRADRQSGHNQSNQPFQPLSPTTPSLRH